MMIFISHATEDDPLVKTIGQRLENRGLEVWVDSRNLRGGDVLDSEIKEAIRTSQAVLGVFSLNGLGSACVHREVRFALSTAKRNGGLPRVVPLRLPPVEVQMLEPFFGKRKMPRSLELGPDPNALDLLLPDLLAALGEVAPDDAGEDELQAARPLAELVLRLSRPERVEVETGKHRPRAEARLELVPADGSPPVVSSPFRLVAPLDPLQAADLSWYLEDW